MSIPYEIMSIGDLVLRHELSPEFALMNAIVKKNDINRKYVLANEIVSHAIAQYLHLPIPPGGVALGPQSTQPYFYSIELLSGVCKKEIKPDPSMITKTQPELAWGIILFDILMINKDRKPRNLIYDKKHKQLYIFDHGNCIYGAIGKRKVINHKNAIGIGEHCLVKNINSLDGYAYWLKIIQEMPDSFIRRSVNLGKELGYSDDDCSLITHSLIARKESIPNFIARQLKKFISMDDNIKALLLKS